MCIAVRCLRSGLPSAYGGPVAIDRDTAVSADRMDPGAHAKAVLHWTAIENVGAVGRQGNSLGGNVSAATVSPMSTGMRGASTPDGVRAAGVAHAVGGVNAVAGRAECRRATRQSGHGVNGVGASAPR